MVVTTMVSKSPTEKQAPSVGQLIPLSAPLAPVDECPAAFKEFPDAVGFLKYTAPSAPVT